MNINVFFTGILIALITIFVAFKPMNIKQQEFTDVPLFQLKVFTLHEFDVNGIITLMKGSYATRYKDRYRVENINYTDNSKKFLANMSAMSGVYRDANEIINLKGNVLYNREDGLMFETDEVSYNKKTSIVQAESDYILYRGSNRVTGSWLELDDNLDIIKSKNIVVKYQLKGK